MRRFMNRDLDAFLILDFSLTLAQHVLGWYVMFMVSSMFFSKKWAR